MPRDFSQFTIIKNTPIAMPRDFSQFTIIKKHTDSHIIAT